MQGKIKLGLVVFREDESEPPFLKAHLKPRYEELEDDEVEEAEFDDHSQGETEGEGDDEVGLQVIGSYFYKQ
jgi:adenine-specific DNA-methyltransferase